MKDQVIASYSKYADVYDSPQNIESIWGRVAEEAWQVIAVPSRAERVVEVGSGTGRALVALAERCPPQVELIGIEPAKRMRDLANNRLKRFPNVRILDGRFEALPLESDTVDYLCSVLAFHWVGAPDAAVHELARVLKPSGSLDLVFTGRHSGREFIEKTSQIFRRRMGLRRWLESAQLRMHFTKDETLRLFSEAFSERSLSIEESYKTYFDTLEGHWSWWVRIEGHFADMSPEEKAACDSEIRSAFSELATDRGIPYTVHLLHVRVGARDGVSDISRARRP